METVKGKRRETLFTLYAESFYILYVMMMASSLTPKNSSELTSLTYKSPKSFSFV